VSERDVNALVVEAVEQIMTLSVAWVETGVVGRRERPIRTQLTAEDKSTSWTTHSDRTTRQRLGKSI